MTPRLTLTLKLTLKEMIDGWWYVFLSSAVGEWDKIIVGKGPTKADAIEAAKGAVGATVLELDKL